MDINCPVDIDSINHSIILFTLDRCKKCFETKRKLDNFSVKYTEINLEICRIVVTRNTLTTVDVAPTIVLKEKNGEIKFIL